MSVIGTIGMVWALAVVAVKLCLTPKVANYVPTVLFPHVSLAGIPDMLVAVFDTVFTFGGQVNWVRWEPLVPTDTCSLWRLQQDKALNYAPFLTCDCCSNESL